MSRTTPARCYLILTEGTPGESYNVGGRNERTNLQVVEAICDLLDELAPPLASGPAPRPDHLRRRPPGPRQALRHRPDQAGDRARLRAAHRLRARHPPDRRLVPGAAGLVAAAARALRRPAPRPERQTRRNSSDHRQAARAAPSGKAASMARDLLGRRARCRRRRRCPRRGPGSTPSGSRTPTAGASGTPAPPAAGVAPCAAAIAASTRPPAPRGRGSRPCRTGCTPTTRDAVRLAPGQDRVLDGPLLQVIEHLVAGAAAPGPASGQRSSRSSTSKLLTPQDRILPSRRSSSNAAIVSASGCEPRQCSR